MRAGDSAPHRPTRPPPKPDPKHHTPAPPNPVGIDYAALIDTTHQAELAREINYAALASTSDRQIHTEIPGQTDLLTGVAR